MKNAKILLSIYIVASIIILFSVNMVAVVASPQTLDGTDLKEFLDAVIHEQMEEFNIPNATVSVVTGGDPGVLSPWLTRLLQVISFLKGKR